jgi:lipopolysaccharide transport system permease protein
MSDERRRRQRLDLVLTLVWRDLTLRYRRSVLGIAWSQVATLSTLAVLALLFSRAIPLHIPNYPLFVVTGLLAWTWFAASVVAATESVVSARDLIRQPGFPAGLLPVVAISTHLIHLLLALPVLLIAVWLVTGHLWLNTLALPALLAVQFLLTLGPAFVLAALHVRFRDVGHLVGVLLMPLFYASPVFYNSELVPHHLRGVYGLNPLEHLLNGYRQVLLAGHWPAAAPLLVIAAVAMAVGIAGYRLFLRRAGEFAEEL